MRNEECGKMKKEFDFQNENLYQDILIYIKLVYKITKKFPKDEVYGLVSQFRRASTSVLLNVVEGWGRYNKGEKTQFYRVSRASLLECIAIIDISKGEEYITKEEYNELIDNCSNLSRRLNGLIKAWEKGVKNENN